MMFWLMDQYLPLWIWLLIVTIGTYSKKTLSHFSNQTTFADDRYEKLSANQINVKTFLKKEV